MFLLFRLHMSSVNTKLLNISGFIHFIYPIIALIIILYFVRLLILL